MRVEHNGMVAYASDSYNASEWLCPIYDLKTNDCICVRHIYHKPSEHELIKIMDKLAKGRR